MNFIFARQLLCLSEPEKTAFRLFSDSQSSLSPVPTPELLYQFVWLATDAVDPRRRENFEATWLIQHISVEGIGFVVSLLQPYFSEFYVYLIENPDFWARPCPFLVFS